MSTLLFKFFRKISKSISGKGLSRLPFAVFLYQSVYKKLKPKGVTTISAGDHTLFIDSHDTGSAPYLIMHGEWDPPQTEVIERLLQKGMTFIDIGANVGYFSLCAAKIVGEEGGVFSFEPDEHNYKLLARNVEKNGYNNITTVKKAVSDTNGRATFYLKEENLSAHSLVKEKNTTAVEVETTTLDDYLDGRDADVIKIDVEGAEPLVLKGMQKTLEQSEKIAVITEFYPNAIAELGYSPEEYLLNLVDMGFVLYRIGEEKGSTPTRITRDMIAGLSIVSEEKRLMNIVCLKNWDL